MLPRLQILLAPVSLLYSYTHQSFPIHFPLLHDCQHFCQKIRSGLTVSYEPNIKSKVNTTTFVSAIRLYFCLELE